MIWNQKWKTRRKRTQNPPSSRIRTGGWWPNPQSKEGKTSGLEQGRWNGRARVQPVVTLSERHPARKLHYKTQPYTDNTVWHPTFFTRLKHSNPYFNSINNILRLLLFLYMCATWVSLYHLSTYCNDEGMSPLWLDPSCKLREQVKRWSADTLYVFVPPPSFFAKMHRFFL